MKKNIKFRISYNAPVTLTFVLLCSFILLIDKTLLGGKFIPAFFTAPAHSGLENGFNPSSVMHYIRLFIHVLGHSDWNHLLGNLSFVLLLGPLLEERYGSKILCLMFLVTALVTGVLNACLLKTPLYGASGIVFMMIVLASITNIEKNVIPLSFILVVALYLGREIITVPKTENISTIAHIIGGVCGSLFGFLVAPKSKRTAKKSKTEADENKKRLEEIDNQSPRFKNGTAPREEDSEVVGTIEL
ncbi:MAG: rhomboid family intramembrane serine protease [Treponema sp.]|nr:rhomboid family intramembrane serine protease [Candidatus Treponema equifaecale]